MALGNKECGPPLYTQNLIMRLLSVILISLFSFNASAQQILSDSSLRQLSIGINTLTMLPNQMSYNAKPIGFVQYRKANHAWRLGLNGGWHNFNRNNEPNLPSSIAIFDSSMVIGTAFRRRSTGGVSLEYVRYSKKMFSHALQVYGGLGVYGGAIDERVGTTYAYYTVDSLGVFVKDANRNNHSETNGNASRKGFQAGVVPSIGFAVMPDRFISLGLELRLPLLYEVGETYDKGSNVSSFNMDTQLALNLSFNLDLAKNK